MENIKPYANSTDSKSQQVETMFNNIAPKYDFLNHALTLGIDKIWRKKAINKVKKCNPQKILDIAAGTGDFTILEAQKTDAQIIGIDISQNMLDIAIKKAENKNLAHRINFMKADSLQMPFNDNSFDVATIGFGIRNFADIPKGLTEIRRVLKPGGKLVVLELSEPPNKIVRGLYSFYFHKVLPTAGKLVSKDAQAYKYLPKSVDNFPYGQPFITLMQNAGYQNSQFEWLSLGLAAIYQAEKPE